MNSPSIKSYHALIIDFGAPVNSRYSIYSISSTQIDNFYDKKPVSDFFWRFEQIFRKYSDRKMLDATIKEKGIAMFNSNRPNTLFTNPYNPNQTLFLAITENKQQIDRLIKVFKL